MDVQFGGIGMESLHYRDVVQSSVTSRVPLPEQVNVKSVLVAASELQVSEAQCAPGQVTVTGELNITFLCEDPAGEPVGFSARSAFRQTADVPGAEEGMRAEAIGQVLETECEPDGDALKVELLTELLLSVRSAGAKKLVTELRGSNSETRYETLSVKRRCLLGETNLRMRDEMPAPEARRVLLTRGAARIKGVQFSGTTANVDGDLFVTALVENEGGELRSMQATLPFRDSFTAVPSENCQCRAFVRSITATAADAGFGVLDVEAVVGMELAGIEESMPRVLVDAYDPDAAFTCDMAEMDVSTCQGITESLVRITENLAVPKHLPEVNQPIFLTVTPAVTGTDALNGRLNVDAMLLVTAVYRCDGGFLHSFTEDVPVRFTLETPPGDLVTARVTLLTATLAGSGRLLEMGLAFSVMAERYGLSHIRAVSEIVSGGEKPKNRGILIYCADAGETLWDVGKRFLVPVEDIKKWNDGVTEALKEGQQILLMR